MLLKRHEGTGGTGAWGEPRHPYHFVAPSREGSEPSIVLCHADVSEPNQGCTELGFTRVEHPVTRLAWESSSKHSMGLVMSGCEEGFIALWDPALIASARGEFEQGLLAKELIFEKEPIMSLEFNALKHNLVAVGSS
jgi:protein transport protein SEC31